MEDKLFRCQFKVKEIYYAEAEYIKLKVYAVHNKKDYFLEGWGNRIVNYCLDNLKDLKVLCKDISPVNPNVKNPIMELKIVDIIKE